MVRSAQEHLRWHVPAQFPAQGALDHDGLEREFLRPGGDIPATVFAVDDELLAFLHHKPHDRSSIGEGLTKAYTRESGKLAGSFGHCALVPPYSFCFITRQPGEHDRPGTNVDKVRFSLQNPASRA